MSWLSARRRVLVSHVQRKRYAATTNMNCLILKIHNENNVYITSKKSCSNLIANHSGTVVFCIACPQATQVRTMVMGSSTTTQPPPPKAVADRPDLDLHPSFPNPPRPSGQHTNPADASSPKSAPTSSSSCFATLSLRHLRLRG